jgi:hypothetical protein
MKVLTAEEEQVIRLFEESLKTTLPLSTSNLQNPKIKLTPTVMAFVVCFEYIFLNTELRFESSLTKTK